MRPKKTLVFIFGIVIILALVKVIVANIFSTKGLQLAQFEKKQSVLLEENNLLEEGIVKFSSLSQISFEAQKLGFAKPSLVVNLAPEVPVALR